MSDVEEGEPHFQSRFDTERVDSQPADGGVKELAGTCRTHRGEWAPVPCPSLEPHMRVLDTWEENENVFPTIGAPQVSRFKRDWKENTKQVSSI